MSRSVSPFSWLWAIAMLTLSTPSPSGAFQPPGAVVPQRPAPEAKQPPITQPLAFVYYAGKIRKRDGRYVLQDSTMPIPFYLDDQEAAKKFAGQDVVIMGVIAKSEPSHVSLQVRQIEAVAPR